MACFIVLWQLKWIVCSFSRFSFVHQQILLPHLQISLMLSWLYPNYQQLKNLVHLHMRHHLHKSHTHPTQWGLRPRDRYRHLNSAYLFYLVYKHCRSFLWTHNGCFDYTSREVCWDPVCVDSCGMVQGTIWIGSWLFHK